MLSHHSQTHTPQFDVQVSHTCPAIHVTFCHVHDNKALELPGSQLAKSRTQNIGTCIARQLHALDNSQPPTASTQQAPFLWGSLHSRSPNYQSSHPHVYKYNVLHHTHRLFFKYSASVHIWEGGDVHVEDGGFRDHFGERICTGT